VDRVEGLSTETRQKGEPPVERRCLYLKANIRLEGKYLELVEEQLVITAFGALRGGNQKRSPVSKTAQSRANMAPRGNALDRLYKWLRTCYRFRGLRVCRKAFEMSNFTGG
jgi:hypothetical protein